MLLFFFALNWFNLTNIKKKHQCFPSEIAENVLTWRCHCLQLITLVTRGSYKVRMTGISCICIVFKMLVACCTHVQQIHFAVFISVLPVKCGKYGQYNPQIYMVKHPSFPDSLLRQHKSMPVECSSSEIVTDLDATQHIFCLK